MYQFREDWDSDIFFWFDKKLVKNKNWALLSQAARSIYPVIACHQNKKGIAFPGEQAISALSGRSEKTVRNGIIALESFPGFTVTPYLTERGRTSKKFTIAKPPETIGRSFPFHKTILESGLWSQLTPSAQSLYIVMRMFAFFNFKIYADEEDIELNHDEYADSFINRKWELCEAEKVFLSSYAGIAPRSLPSAIKSLCGEQLVEKYEGADEARETFKVFVRPPVYYKRSWLNGKNYRSRGAETV